MSCSWWRNQPAITENRRKRAQSRFSGHAHCHIHQGTVDECQPRVEKGDFEMLITKKMLLVLTLAGALVGAGIGALVTHSASNDNARTASASYDTTQTAQTAQTANQADKTADQLAAENSSQFKSPEEQTAYRQGFNDGYIAADNARTGTSSRTIASYRGPVRRYYNGRRVYYDYSNQPRGRTFW